MVERKVKFKKYIDPTYKENLYDENFISRRKPDAGTGKYEDDFTHDGVFLNWGLDFQELENGVGTYSVALVMLKDGTIEEITPNCLKFVTNKMAFETILLTEKRK